MGQNCLESPGEDNSLSLTEEGFKIELVFGRQTVADVDEYCIQRKEMKKHSTCLGQ